MEDFGLTVRGFLAGGVDGSAICQSGNLSDSQSKSWRIVATARAPSNSGVLSITYTSMS